MAGKKVILLGERRYNADWLRSVPEGHAVLRLRGHCEVSQIRNAWKQANGKSVRNYVEPVEKPVSDKPKRKRTTPNKKKSNK